MGVFEIGMIEYDANLVLTAMEPAQEFFGMKDSISGIEVRLKDIYRAAEVKKHLQGALGLKYLVLDWMPMNKNLFSALKLEKFAMFVILVLIILVASFNIVSTLIMNVIEKKREIAILKAMGDTDKGIMTIFMLQGLIIGLVGTCAGAALGYTLAFALDRYKLIKVPNDVYQVSHVPFTVLPWDFAVVVLSAVLICFVATLYPSRHHHPPRPGPLLEPRVAARDRPGGHHDLAARGPPDVLWSLTSMGGPETGTRRRLDMECSLSPCFAPRAGGSCRRF